MSMTIEKLKALKADMKKLREEMAQQAKDGFHESVKELFEQHPTLISFSWNQYTPYFNDGETCYFSAWTEDIDLQTADDMDNGFSAYQCTERDENGKRVPKKDITPFQKAGLAVLEVLEVFDGDDYEGMFGDHCEITVTRDGVEVEEYEHD